ncbi:mitotic spindle assembly checkpoint protein MAD1 isoform X2 [Latimeria chalumnae]|uniref:mitotic spindle assembly checkpoint protein MAD1 isoform X2 n=1 Tax=Latimeria chalumnae TaxID=7897 RepID=UPI0003C10C70|nr:PREDICTED: mitotic spindle assembly checkpoint protein MAD1 isoform X3 [Latimeria chalumnae]|eukprot:XP_005990930.1 PREDICTED: mitotic spindle assembly checkpoint protein MAD1 isoform X3 [Latimeria chalumnae]
MEDLEDNTTVFTTLRSFNNFLSQRTEATPVPETSSASCSLQLQYRKRMQLEEQAEQIHSKSQLLQVEREKMQMELSHKRARIELEKAAQNNAKNYERVADQNQELLGRIKYHQEKESEAEKKLQEQIEINKIYKKSMETQNKKLQEKESKLAEANEMISVLKAKISELQHKSMNQERQQVIWDTERQELHEKVEIQRKKWQEATQKLQMLQVAQTISEENEQKIKDLETKLSLQEQDSVIVKNMKSDLARVPEMEKELRRLREENAFHRETKENNALLQEEVEGLHRKVERYEKMREDMVNLELEKEKLLGKLKGWENLKQMTGLNIESPEDLSREIIILQQKEITLKQQHNSVTNSARALEKARQQLQEEVLHLRTRNLENENKQEQQNALVRRLQKRVLLLTKVELSKALEEVGSHKLKAQTLEAELKILKNEAAIAEKSSFINSEEANSLRQKIEELEGERGRLEEENRGLMMRLERSNLQGDYDPTRIKVIHFSQNPVNLAKQHNIAELHQLREECERLRELVRVLEGGGSVPEKLEGAVNLPSSQEITDLRKQVESAELKNQRLKEVFQKKIQEFRTVCYTLTGFQIDITTENQYRLTSMYAEHKDDCLLFKTSGPTGGKMQLLETDFSRTLHELIELHLLHQDSIPAFLSAVTLDLFSRQTIA